MRQPLKIHLQYLNRLPFLHLEYPAKQFLAHKKSLSYLLMNHKLTQTTFLFHWVWDIWKFDSVFETVLVLIIIFCHLLVSCLALASLWHTLMKSALSPLSEKQLQEKFWLWLLTPASKSKKLLLWLDPPLLYLTVVKWELFVHVNGLVRSPFLTSTCT